MGNHSISWMQSIESSISTLFGVSYLILEYQTAGTGVSLS